MSLIIIPRYFNAKSRTIVAQDKTIAVRSWRVGEFKGINWGVTAVCAYANAQQ